LLLALPLLVLLLLLLPLTLLLLLLQLFLLLLLLLLQALSLLLFLLQPLLLLLLLRSLLLLCDLVRRLAGMRLRRLGYRMRLEAHVGLFVGRFGWRIGDRVLLGLDRRGRRIDRPSLLLQRLRVISRLVRVNGSR